MRFKIAMSVLFVSVSAVACESPLLNHVDAASRDGAEQVAVSERQCPLAFPKHGLCAELVWESVLNDQDPASFKLRFWNATEGTSFGPYVDPSDSVGVKLLMPSMGHGSSPVKLSREAPGVYQGSDAYFIMPGAWDVRVQLKKGTQVLEEAILAVRI